MGLYIEQLKNGRHFGAHTNKGEQLLGDGARELFGDSIRLQPNLVCVVQNPTYDAAAYIYDKKEFARFRRVDDRVARWFVYEGSPDIARMNQSLAMDD